MQISHIVNSCKRLADQGRVLEGVADKPFFFTSSLWSLCFFATVRSFDAFYKCAVEYHRIVRYKRQIKMPGSSGNESVMEFGAASGKDSGISELQLRGFCVLHSVFNLLD